MEEWIINNISEESRLYKVLKVKMKDFESHKEIVRTKTGEEKRNKKGQIVKKIVTDNIIKIITKDIEYIDKNNEKKVNQTTVISNNNIRQFYTLVKDPETIRIVRKLDLKNNNSSIEDGDYIFIKDIITADVKVKTYKEETKETIVLSYQEIDKDGKIKIDKNGKQLITNVTYTRLMASTGNIRSNKVTFIRKELFDKANDILLCGMHDDMEYDFFSKFNAYYALANTDSTAVTMPRIVVIKDYEKGIKETFDIVNEIKQDVYEVINNDTNHTEKIKPFDGAGLCDIHWASKVAMAKLKLDYLPSAFQFRVIPGIKGNVYTFDIGEFAREHNKTTIIDAWGKQWNIFDKKGNLLIDVILTVSQFKFFKKYANYNEWLSNFKTVTHGYRRTFNISKYADRFEEIKDKALLSYQPLQSLNLDEKQIKKLCTDTVKTIKEISTNVDSFLKYRGLLDEEEGKKSKATLIPEYYKALQQNKSLFQDVFIQSKIQRDLNNFKEKIYRGAVFIPGNYQTFIPDIVGLAEYSMGLDVKGCLNAYEVYSKYWCKWQVLSVKFRKIISLNNFQLIIH